MRVKNLQKMAVLEPIDLGIMALGDCVFFFPN
jgi:hypothetical protein